MGYKHASIPTGVAALQKLGAENGFDVDTTKNSMVFESDSLQQYAAVVFLSTTGNVLDARQEAGFERYIQAGGGFVGVHAATDTEYDWNWYGKLVGAYFLSHPRGTPEADFVVKNHEFAATQFFEDSLWHRTDELYNFKKINPDVEVIMTVNEDTYEGGANGDYHPMSWYHEYDGGRAFYTALGHTDESYADQQYLQHLLGGIQYAIGDNKMLDYSLATTQLPPDADRFTKKQLITGEFFEPTEMAVLPNNDVLIAQRRGEIMLYKDDTQELSQVASLDVYSKTLNTPNVNAEEGLMGLQKDPNFAQNHWIYVYYSPTGDKWINRLSRFKFIDGSFDKASEQVILELDTQREICCHTGGSIAFGPDNLLYLSTGDNSTPFNEKNVEFVNNGFAPLNDVPGHKQYDARRSAGNTNDLRGKILRIRVNEDGSYEIPEGNLFPEGTDKARPEIYTMGHRNPYRISVDPKNGYLYWGEVGPDARADSMMTRGPKGYDEMNQAREAGNFGWPLFIADNKPYRRFDYETGESGSNFDPEKPINDSRNNTGLKELPKAMPAYAYYPYDESSDFPQVGTGSRNAMAGPVYYADMYPSENSLPDYYDGKVFVYDWMRGWIKAVSLFPDGEFNKMEPFAEEITLNNLIDVEMSSDGRMYLLEYGSGWFTKNEDSGLSYIEYNGGNRPPMIDSLVVDKTSGQLPLAITAKVAAQDREEDPITYVWDLGDGETEETTSPEISHTYDVAGEYKVSVVAKDKQNATTQSSPVSVVAGNSRPVVSIALSGGNSSFYIPGVPIQYEVSVTDEDEGENIDNSNIFVSVDYLEGMDQVAMSLGHQQVSAAVTGKALTLSMDCKTCHKENGKSVGPAYVDVAAKYSKDANAMGYLQKKIVSGGAGAWGDVAMPAHPNLSKDDTRQLVTYILSLAGNKEEEKSLPPAGKIVPQADQGTSVMVLTASYTDQGADQAKPLTGSKSVVLRSSDIAFSEDTQVEGFRPVSFNGINLMVVPKEEGWIALEDIDLTGVKSANVGVVWQTPPTHGLDVELHLDAPDGKLIGTGSMPVPKKDQPGGTVPIKLAESIDQKVEKIYFVSKPKGEAAQGEVMVALNGINFSGK